MPASNPTSVPHGERMATARSVLPHLRRSRTALHLRRVDRDGSHEDGTALVELEGELTTAERATVRDRLSSLLVAHHGVLVDLNRLRITSTRSLEVFTAALDRAGGWPEARLVVFSADRMLRHALQTSGVGEHLWVAHSEEIARARCAERPRRVRAEWSAPPGPGAPAALRGLTHRRWTRWGLPADVLDEAALVVNELVSNAVDHARTALRVSVVLDGDLLRIRVRDESPDPPRLQPHDVQAARGRGLQLVDALALRWGWAAHEDGKTVWAILRAGADRGGAERSDTSDCGGADDRGGTGRPSTPR